MAETKLRNRITLKQSVNNFLYNWYQFPIDYWWRKKYNVPFGSSQHREMNFIDMYIEFQESVVVDRTVNKIEYEDVDELLGLNVENNDTVKLTEKEIDNDFDNLDLSQFDKQE